MVQILENPLILVDGSSYLYRAYYAFPPLTNSLDEPTGAIYGVVNMLKNILMQYNPSHFAVVFDAKGKSFRSELFKAYKVHRPPMPDNLRVQIAPLHQMIKAMGLPLVTVSGVEADDVIGTLARQAEKEGRSVLISTGDKDMAQLVTQNITLMNTMTKEILGPSEVKKKYGVVPSLIIDFLTIVGDSSDNIPGIPGIGKKTALVLLQELGGIQSIYDNLDKVANLSLRGARTMAAKLEKNRKIAFLSYQLITIKTNVELNLTCSELTVNKPDIAMLQKLFSYYEFKHWLSDLEEEKWLKRKKNNLKEKCPLIVDTSMKPQANSVIPSDKNMIILDQKTFDLWLEKVKNSDLFAFKLQTDSLDIFSTNIIGIALAIAPGEAAYLPVGHDYPDAQKQLNRRNVLAQLKPIFENNNVKKVGQNMKSNYGVLKNYDIELGGIKFDTMLESYLLNSVDCKYDMACLARRWLNRKAVTFEDIAGKGKNQLTFNQITLEKAAYYATEEADITLQLHLKIWPELRKETCQKTVFEEIDMPLLTVLSRIERNGVLIEPVSLEQYSKELTMRLTELEQQAHELVGKPFNLASTKQLQKIFFENQGMRPTKKTRGGVPSTNEAVLAELALDYQLPKVILEHRGLLKLKSTYTDKLPKMINRLTGRVHTSYHQAVTTTGRLSSTDPNLQNIPVRDEQGRRIRQAFIAEKGHCILAADYSQIELRIMAHLSQDKGLQDAFAYGQDIHRSTAAEVFGVVLSRVSVEQRRSAKAINFGLIYGMSAFGLSRQLNISSYEAKKYMDLYFKRYPNVLRYMKETREQAVRQGYVETLFGRRLWLPNIKSSNAVLRKTAERAAINAPMQGTAADIVKRAMIAIDRWIQQQNSSNKTIRMIMQVHDELVFEVRSDIVVYASQKIRELMEGSIILDVPLKVEIGIGENWDQAH
ncbi:DNA polymerase I [Pantoea sp. Nvir]|uniref:DNA polymerase I n=1 Tax=Pantoea sp. Nvir TaxID=2576760 RepID=UPI00135C420A|nr:DNA polymerase I [Pantoea sp. Nvir]MXP67034.1 DNA polymerase I [Pantoea sp. Nvir]